LRQDVAAEGVDEFALVASDMMQMVYAETDLGIGGKLGGMPYEIRRDVQRLPHVLGMYEAADPLEIRRRAQIPIDVPASGAEAPLLMGRGQRSGLGLVPAQSDLKDLRFAFAAATTEGVDHRDRRCGFAWIVSNPSQPQTHLS
jgi:hypothetical protein